MDGQWCAVGAFTSSRPRRPLVEENLFYLDFCPEKQADLTFIFYHIWEREFFNWILAFNKTVSMSFISTIIQWLIALIWFMNDRAGVSRLRPMTNPALHILSRALALEASTSWHWRVYRSEMGHDDKLFTSDRWLRYKFFFLSCLLALMPGSEKRSCCELYDKMLYPPLTFTEWVSGGDFVWNKAPVSISRCVTELKGGDWASTWRPPPFVSPLSFGVIA